MSNIYPQNYNWILNADGYPSWNNLVVLWAQNEFMLQINIGLEFLFVCLFASIFY